MPNRYDIPKYAKACVLTEPGRFEIRDDVEVRLPGKHEVLCKIRAVAICGSDPEIFRGDLAGTWPPAYPFVAGHEWAGEIVAVGEGVTEFHVGDRVAGEAHKGCGYCDNCKKGRYTICLNYGKTETGHEHYGFIVNGAYGQYQTYSIRSITKIPDPVSFEEAAMCDTAGVALHGLELSGITPGGTVAIIGPGPIGLCAMRLAKAMGAARIIVIGRGSRLSSAQKLGADICVDFTKEDPVEAVRRITGGLGVDEAFECSGAKGTFNQAVRMVRKGGKVVLLGVATDDVVEELPFKYVTHNEIAIFGSRANPNVSWKVLNLMATGQLNVKDLITHKFPLENFADALDTFVNRKENAVKVVILPNGEI
ncbi:MAG TPA: zinc-binding dehydrogenase [Clostridiaceae bacterium]|jgi:L-iditol 2-dehydrogenase|nr:zinc-binding dehydrogenase [Clostridiaceae bacterium]